MRRTVSWLFLMAGVALLGFGSREYLTSIWDQREIAASWRDFDDTREAEPQESPAKFAREGRVRVLPNERKAARQGDTLARMSIPRLKAEMFIVEGTGKKQLRRGPGHLEGTALPGTDGNSVIAGHRDTHFRVLKDIEKGDEIIVDTAKGQFLYKVTSIVVVSPNNTKSLEPTGQAVLNLVTCYPFYMAGPAPKRFVVRAELATAIRSVS